LSLRVLELEKNMNVQIAKNAYSKIKKETRSNERVNHSNVGLALKKLQSSMSNMQHLEEGEMFEKSWKNALYSIYFLQKSLDFDKGGEIATNLFRLYEFCKINVQEVAISVQPEKSNLHKCIEFIEQIIISWDKVYE